MAFIEQKKNKFEQILPELKAKLQISKQLSRPTENATIYKDTRGISEVYRQLREEKGKEYLSFGGGKVCEDRMGTAWWKNHHLNRIKNNYLIRNLLICFFACGDTTRIIFIFKNVAVSISNFF